jgi:proteasome lid subunit RPN8/RPN11
MKRKLAASVLLSTSAWKTILLDVCARQEIEACGALLGRRDQEGNWHVAEAVPMRNIFASPIYFEFDPSELVAIDLEQPERMIGVYHSHPAGPAMASATDRQNMQRVNIEQQIPWVWVILSGPFTSPSSDGPVGADGPPDEGKITVRGVVAYHHYHKLGLQRVTIQRVETEHSGSPAHQ